MDELHEKQGLHARVINRLKADEAMNDSVRRVALQIANVRLWEDAEDSEGAADGGEEK